MRLDFVWEVSSQELVHSNETRVSIWSVYALVIVSDVLGV